jgi:hypothetical protein
MQDDAIPGGIWVFQAPLKGRFAGGLFSTRAEAEAWIERHALSGVLTLYPLDEGVYNWAIQKGLFRPKKPHESEAPFIGGFTTASQPHYHYEGGREGEDEA